MYIFVQIIAKWVSHHFGHIDNPLTYFCFLCQLQDATQILIMQDWHATILTVLGYQIQRQNSNIEGKYEELKYGQCSF